MKLSCLPVSLYADFVSGRRSLADWFGFAAELGLEGADVSVAHLESLEAAYLDSLRENAHAVGVQIVMLVTYSDFTHPDPDERTQQVAELEAYIAAAARFGAPYVRVTAGQAHPGVKQAQGIEWAVNGLTSCLTMATEANVTVVYENHTRGSVWTYDDFSRPAEIFLNIAQQTAQSELKILYDTANTLGHGDDPLAVLDAVKDRVAVIHVNDIRRAGDFEPVIAGTGVAPIPAILANLFENGFNGWISVEEASMQGEEGFRQAIPYVRKLMH